MKKTFFFTALISLLLSGSSCMQDEQRINIESFGNLDEVNVKIETSSNKGKEYLNTINKETILLQVQQFTCYSIEKAYACYDSDENYIDIDALEEYIKQYVGNENLAITRVDNYIPYENAVEQLNSLLSEEASQLFMAFINSKPSQIADIESLKLNIENLNGYDKELLSFLVETTEVVFDELMNSEQTTTRSVRNGLACAITADLAGLVTGAIWGTFFGGPIGVAVDVAWSVAATIASYYRCVES